MVQFKLIDIIGDDIKEHGEDYTNCFFITLYGKTIDNKSIICNVSKFRPFFYVRIPDNWYNNKTKIKNFLNIDPKTKDVFDSDIKGIYDKEFISKYGGDPVNDFISYEFVLSKDFYGFQCDKDKNELHCTFIKLYYSSYCSMNRFIQAFRKVYSIISRKLKDEEKLDSEYAYLKQWVKLDKLDQCDSNLYESNVHPLLRFIHSTNIKSADWIQCDISDNELTTSPKFPNSQVLDDIDYTRISPVTRDSVTEYIIASYDIECDSSHGDFPQANKDYKKLCIDLYDTLHRAKEKGRSDIQINNSLSKLCIKAAFFEESHQSLHDFDDHIHMNSIHTVDNNKPTSSQIDLIHEYYTSDSYQELFWSPKQRDKSINYLNSKIKRILKGITVEGDKVIQIGTVFHKYGDTEPYFRHILVIGPDGTDKGDICKPLDEYNITVETCDSEEELLVRWKDIINQVSPDFITGYNIFGFDFGYMIDRMKVYCCGKKHCSDKCKYKSFFDLGKISQGKVGNSHRNKKCCEKTQKSSSFIRNDDYRYIHMDGRVLFDLQKEIEKSHNLESYKLDNVASHFMRGKIKQIQYTDNTTYLLTKEFGQLKVGDYISLRLHSNIGETYYNDGEKIVIDNITSDSICINKQLEHHSMSTWSPGINDYFKVEWCLNKDDITPQDIFDKHRFGTGEDRAEVAKYCIQDCELCINLALNLDIVSNAIAMANVCCVPLSYIFLRGQGAKIYSLIAKECNLKGYRIPTLKRPTDFSEYYKAYKTKGRDHTRELMIKDKEMDDSWSNKYSDHELEDYLDEIANPLDKEGYEGAIVLDPTPGIYVDDPIGVVDYASLYPSSIIEKNLSHETQIVDKKYLDLLDESDYCTITYDGYKFEAVEGTQIVKKIKVKDETPEAHDAEVTCHFLKNKYNNSLGIIPSVLQHLLQQRSMTKKLLKKETNEFKRKVLDGEQLSYKLVANSVYGQMGARTSPIYKNKIAACTTAIGRQRIYDAKDGIEQDWWNLSEKAKQWECKPPKVIYGDTDSVFIKFSRYKNGKELVGKEALQFCIECGQDAGEWITKYSGRLEHPQDLEYEKTFWPFVLISKKRYVGDKYEFTTEDPKRTSMGIVLKRRDNAHIVKHVFGTVIEQIMVNKNLEGTIVWLQEELQKIREGHFPMSQFIISKSLRGYYKNPGSIAHKVLADRMGERDPGNRPKPGDRIQYAYMKVDESPQPTGVFGKIKQRVENGTYKSGKPKYKTITVTGKEKMKKRTILQGDRIEDPTYIMNNKDLELDYPFYISNQIKNPVKQVLDLEMDTEETELLFN